MERERKQDHGAGLPAQEPQAGLAGDRVLKGHGCPFKSKKITNKKLKKGSVSVIKKLGKQRTFRAGQTVTVRVTAKNYNTKFAIFKIKAGNVPNGVAKCRQGPEQAARLPLGARQQ